MDQIDKNILIELEGNCRLTYQSIADKIGLSRSAVKRRVDTLLELGVIEEFIIELSKNMVGYNWLCADIFTTGSEDTEKFSQALSKHPMVFITTWLGSGRYLNYCHVDSQYSSYELGKFIRKRRYVTKVHLNPMIPVTNKILSPDSQFQGTSEKTEFTNGQLRVLKSLIKDARKPISSIAEETKMSSKRVKALLDEIHSLNAIHFTIHFNFSAGGNINFVLKLVFDEKKAEPTNIVEWIQTHHSYEYWNSFLYVQEPILMNFFSCSHLRDVRRITQSIEKTQYAITAEPLVIYPTKMSKGLGRLRIEELLSKVKL